MIMLLLTLMEAWNWAVSNFCAEEKWGDRYLWHVPTLLISGDGLVRCHPCKALSCVSVSTIEDYRQGQARSSGRVK
jgi:hypothetical protein